MTAKSEVHMSDQKQWEEYSENDNEKHKFGQGSAFCQIFWN